MESSSAKKAPDQLLSASGIQTKDVYMPEDTAGIDYKKDLGLPCARRLVQVGTPICSKDRRRLTSNETDYGNLHVAVSGLRHMYLRVIHVDTFLESWMEAVTLSSTKEFGYDR